MGAGSKTAVTAGFVAWLFNALYSTPPMFWLKGKAWEENRERFVKSYQASAAITRATGYSEMTDHKFLTPGREVQQTRFANGVVVTVNFGAKSFAGADGLSVGAGQVVTSGVK